MAGSLEEQIVNEQVIAVISSTVKSDNLIEETINTEINSATMINYLQEKFPDRIPNKNKKRLELVISDLKYAGIRRIGDLEKIVNNYLEWFNSFEKANPASDSANHSYSGIGVIRIILSEKLFASEQK